jgi:hypothetical protein
VLEVALPDFLRLGVGFCVVVAIGQTQATLVQLGDLLLDIVRIGGRIRPKQYRRSVGHQLKARHQRGKLPGGFDGGNRIQLRAKRRQAALIRRRLVHASSVEIADLPSERIALRRGGCAFENAVEQVEVVLVELAIDIPTRLVRGNGILLFPSSAGILIQIDARVDRLVQRSQIQAGAVGQRGFGGRS